MKRKKLLSVLLVAAIAVGAFTGCGGGSAALNDGEEMQEVDIESLAFPLAEKATITGMTSFPVGTESEPNNRTIFKRLEEDTYVHVEWTAISSDQWGDKI